jgi:hypothetical protein
MTDQVRIQLADSLGRRPEEIMDYRAGENGRYTVILWSHQKFVGVKLKEPPIEEAVTVYGASGKGYGIPPHLQVPFANPRRATATELRELLSLLDVPVRSRATKPVLVQLISEWKASALS